MSLLLLVQVPLALVRYLLKRVHELFNLVSELVDLHGLLLVSLIRSEGVPVEAPLRLLEFKLSSLLLHL